MLAVAQQRQPAAQHHIVQRLAAMRRDRPALPGPRDAQPRIDLVRAAPDERGTEPAVQVVRHGLRQRPGQHTAAGGTGGDQRRPGGLLVVGVTGHAALVEHEEMARILLADQPAHVPSQLVQRAPVQATVGVVQQLHRLHTQHRGRGPQLDRADHAQLPGATVQRGRLAVGKTQHRDGNPAAGQPVHQRAQTERLVVRVRHHRQHPVDVPGQPRPLVAAADRRVRRALHHHSTIPPRVYASSAAVKRGPRHRRGPRTAVRLPGRPGGEGGLTGAAARRPAGAGTPASRQPRSARPWRCAGRRCRCSRPAGPRRSRRSGWPVPATSRS